MFCYEKCPYVAVCQFIPFLYNRCKSTFQFSNPTKYGHGPPEDGFKGDQNM